MGQTPEEGVKPMSHFYPPPMGHPGWYPRGAWYPTGAASPAGTWYPAASAAPPPPWLAAAGPAPYGVHVPPGWGSAPDPVVVEWMAVLEPALSSVIPAIQGLLQISGMLLRQLPDALDISPYTSETPAALAPGERAVAAPADPAGAAGGDPEALSFGMGHAGLFGPTGTDAVELGAADAGARPGAAEADAGDPDGESTAQA